MNRKLFWKLCVSISLISICLVYLISELSISIERNMSYVEAEDKRQLLAYRDQVEMLLGKGDHVGLQSFLSELEAQEQTFVSVIEVTSREIASFNHQDYTPVEIRLGRSLNYPIHLHHDNPFIEMPLNDGARSLVIRLPDHMMPGSHWPLMHMVLHLIVPLLMMAVVSFCIYRHLMKPLAKLEIATREFSKGNYSARVANELNGRSDELGNLAQTFDEMAEKVGHLVESQRHLIHDLSHELRTPLQRIELSIEAEKPTAYKRLKREAGLMRNLVEDTLTLAWLENESPDVRHESVDLIGLIEAIADDTRFEFPDRALHLLIPDHVELHNSSEKALNMALENIIRNAMRHSPVGGAVVVDLSTSESECSIRVQDQGPGVEEAYLELIFKPFFRVDKSRERERGGFGLGLALAKRQISGLGGQVTASSVEPTGLEMSITLPLQ